MVERNFDTGHVEAVLIQNVHEDCQGKIGFAKKLDVNLKFSVSTKKSRSCYNLIMMLIKL